MKRSDLFEQMVGKLLVDGGEIHYLSCVVRHRDAVTLLRRQHAEIERMTRDMRTRMLATNARGLPARTFQAGAVQACDELLVKLADMKKGTQHGQ